MSKVFMPLANMDFANVVNEAKATTVTGEQLLNKYRKVLLANESTCGLVNNFVKEAQNYRYDAGINYVLENVCEVIKNNKVSWQLATACESINNNGSAYNYLNRNAAKQAENLLEGKTEEEVVKYIKAGALKNVMWCESIRNIVRGVYESTQTIVTDEYAATKPISYVEESEENTFFEVLGHIYKINGDNIDEASHTEVSREFIECSQLVESGAAKFEGDSLTVRVANAEYVIECCLGDAKDDPEAKKAAKVICKRKTKKGEEVKEQEFDNVDALREHNRLVVGSAQPNQQGQLARVLEQVAKCWENFDKFTILDNAQIILTKNDKFLVIENGANAFAMSLGSNHTNAWKVNTNIVEALDFIKSKTNVDIKKDYAKNIEEAYDNRSEEEKKQLQEQIEAEAIEARKKKIEELREQYKNEPKKLAVLAAAAEELSKI
jgi:hypothetical protein